LGNSPDPIDLIAKFGADGVRVGMLLCSPAGNDLMFDESYCEQGRNFANKIWNAFRLVKGWEVSEELENPNQTAISWFKNRFNQATAEIEEAFKDYRLSEAIMAVYKLVWDDFCAWYLEMVKPVYQQPIDVQTFNATIGYFEEIIKLLHPFMPFITEELWHDELFGTRTAKDCCIVAQLPSIEEWNTQQLSHFENVKQVITEIRNTRNNKKLSPKETLDLSIKQSSDVNYEAYLPVIKKLGNIGNINFTDEKVIGAVNFLVSTDEFFIPLSTNIDAGAELLRLQKEKDYLLGFLKSVDAKLSNEKFVNNAKPEVIDNERKKKADAEAKLKIVEDNLKFLAN